MKSVVSRDPATTDVAICHYCGLPAGTLPSADEPVFCCYGCRFAASISAAVTGAPPISGPASALGFSVFFTMNVVMLTMALWSYTDETNSAFQAALGHFFRYGAMAFALPVLLLLGRPLMSHALQALRRKTFSTDLLLATGVLAAFAVSVINTWRGSGHIYYEVGCVILVLVTLGRWLEAAGRSQASAALDQLEQLVPETVRQRVMSGDVITPRNVVLVGDRLHILAGERIPLDGRVIQGRGVVDEQFFTGESTPVEKQPGDLLLGGSLNLDGDLIIEVTAPPEAGALGRLVEGVRTARLSKGRYQLLSDTWSSWFFPIISVVSVTAFIVHGLRVDWSFGLLTALSVVLIACPCALALATPLAVWTALGAAAKKGVLFRSGAALETLARARAIRWDKTGTLTTGSPRVKRLACEHMTERDTVEAYAAVLTKASIHVYSQAIGEFLADDCTVAMPFANDGIKTVAGRGLTVQLADGRRIALGSIRWMNECSFAWGPNLSAVLANPETSDCPVTAIGFEGYVQGLFLLEETLRPEAADAMARIHGLGLNQAMLTGDRRARALRLAETLTWPSSGLLDVAAELLPEDKLAAIHTAHQQWGCVAMVGDGLNDAAALAAADIGIALGCGADVTRDSADICLLSADLMLVPWAVEYSRRTVRTIRANLAWSFGYNSLGMIVAASGQLHPALAAALMVVSSLMVLGNSLRLRAASCWGPSDSAGNHSEEAHSELLDGVPNSLKAIL